MKYEEKKKKGIKKKCLIWEEAVDVVEVRDETVSNGQPLPVEKGRGLFKRRGAILCPATSSELVNKSLLRLWAVPREKGDHTASKKVAHQDFGSRDMFVPAERLEEGLKVLGF